MRKKILPSLALGLLTPLMASALGIQVVIDGQAVVFSDVSESAWFAEYVRASAEAGIVSGYRDSSGKPTGKFGPGNEITLAEALKIAVEGAGFNEQAYASVIDSDVGSHWAAPYVAVAKGEGFEIMNKSRINWDSPATRAEVASMFVSAFSVSTDLPVEGNFTDVDSSMQYSESINALSSDSVVSGDTGVDGKPTGTFRPTAAINRAEVAKIAIKSRETYNQPGADKKPSDSQVNADENTVIYGNAGFSPSVLRVKVGTSVKFVNDTTEDMWVATDSHPEHGQLPGFDARKIYGQGETYIYKFNEIGTWTYHNHYNPSDTGTVIVGE